MSAPTNVRTGAAEILDRALASGQPIDRSLGQGERGLDGRDRALLRELVLGTLRWLRRLDSVIEAASSREMGSIDLPLRNPLRLAAYQILFLDRIPAHAAVNEAVEEARQRTHRGGAGFANAVLRQISRSPTLDAWPVTATDPIRRVAIETSHPDLLVERWLHLFGKQVARQILDANNRRKPWQILTFREKGGREEAARRLAEEGIQTLLSEVAPCGLVVTEGNPLESALLAEGSIYLQDEASQAAALIPPPVGPERVLDLAAAPGGKTLSLLSWQPQIGILAADRSLDRLGILRANRDRLGLKFELMQTDGLAPPLSASTFDRVVLDLPCSGSGTLRKHPELKWRITADEINRLCEQGLEMVMVGSRLVRRAGLLCVITCSLEPEENSQVIARFLERRSDFARVPLVDELPDPLGRWIVGEGAWQILPAGAHDGFTVHALRRRT